MFLRPVLVIKNRNMEASMVQLVRSHERVQLVQLSGGTFQFKLDPVELLSAQNLTKESSD